MNDNDSNTTGSFVNHSREMMSKLASNSADRPLIAWVADGIFFGTMLGSVIPLFGVRGLNAGIFAFVVLCSAFIVTLPICVVVYSCSRMGGDRR